MFKRYEVHYKGELWAKFNNYFQAQYLGKNIMEIDVDAEPDDYTLLHILEYTLLDDIRNYILKKVYPTKCSLGQIIPMFKIIVWSKKEEAYIYM